MWKYVLNSYLTSLASLEMCNLYQAIDEQWERSPVNATADILSSPLLFLYQTPLVARPRLDLPR